MDHPLDNPVWQALTSAHKDIAIGRGAARHYPRDAAPFAALAEASPAAYAALAEDLPPGIEARLFRPSDEPLPAGWEAVSARPILQMVLDAAMLPGVLPAESAAIPLGPRDAEEMLALAGAARPGPFGTRTATLGQYIGIRDAQGRLLAMAGERFRLPGHVELSAICVHPGARGRGFGAALTLRLSRAALCRGETPFLHVFPDNAAAMLYRRLGFLDRATLHVLWRRPIAMGRLA